MQLNKTMLLMLLCLSMAPLNVTAWGVDGHRIVGTNALPWLDDLASQRVDEILGGASEATLEKACNWPDTVRETPEWSWSAPLHYLNIPRHAQHYDRQRDCPDGQCVTEAIIRYANELHLKRHSEEQRWQALGWLCHLVGDLHQPLHAGFADDRGGNRVQIRFNEQDYNLHYFWDTALVRNRLEKNGNWSRPLDTSQWPTPPQQWPMSSVADWTNQSHALAIKRAYPESSSIDEAFADTGWVLIRKQWQRAGYRLAMILNAVLGEGEPVVSNR